MTSKVVMASKDRLADLRKLSHEAACDEECVAIEVMTPEVKTSTRKTKKPSDPFFEEVEEIQTAIANMKEDIQKVQELNRFDEGKKADLEALNTTINKSALGIKSELKIVTKWVSKLESRKPNSTELQMKKMHLNRLQKSYIESVEEHLTSRVNYQSKQKDLLRRQLHVMGRDTTEEQLDEMFETGNVSVFTEGLLMETENQKKILAQVESRHSQIMNLEKNITTLNELFEDMAFAMTLQGELIDNIEYNVSKTRGALQGGKGLLEDAQFHQREIQRDKFWNFVRMVLATVSSAFPGARSLHRKLALRNIKKQVSKPLK